MFSPEIAASADTFEWIGNPELISSYEAPILHEPPAYRRNFCSNCGSPLPVVIKEAGIAILHAGLLDRGTELPIFRHAFVGQKFGGFEITDGKPQFDAQPPAPDRSSLFE